MELETERLLLRSLSSDDWQFFKHLHQLPDVMRFISDMPTLDVIKQRFDERCISWQKQSNDWLTLTMFNKNTMTPIGVTGFLSQWQPYQQAELGFMLDPEFQGLGYAKESTRRVTAFAFDECDYHKVTATVTQGNDASSRLLTALGFKLEGVIRDNYKIDDKWFNDQKFGMLKSEFS
ncbi:GNAT family N-acetyltransferase [Pseudoalteromonas sp. T1lg24]|uniref:GNAT family N-acetyltransferase n=1 Tax=Pseudoalteromonas sp. T1lg24 TaxID=2077099 RepID=UPI000CF6AAFE|nr:GNAT family protein [Pseudoalteromonas sp. T1lg24]